MKLSIYHRANWLPQSKEEKHKAHTYDLIKEVVSPNGKVVVVTEKFSGDSGDL